VLEAGRVALTGTGEDLLNDPEVSRLNLGHAKPQDSRRVNPADVLALQGDRARTRLQHLQLCFFLIPFVRIFYAQSDEEFSCYFFLGCNCPGIGVSGNGPFSETE
jgi:hypothetical protein